MGGGQVDSGVCRACSHPQSDACSHPQSDCRASHVWPWMLVSSYSCARSNTRVLSQCGSMAAKLALRASQAAGVMQRVHCTTTKRASGACVHGASLTPPRAHPRPAVPPPVKAEVAAAAEVVGAEGPPDAPVPQPQVAVLDAGASVSPVKQGFFRALAAACHVEGSWNGVRDLVTTAAREATEYVAHPPASPDSDPQTEGMSALEDQMEAMAVLGECLKATHNTDKFPSRAAAQMTANALNIRLFVWSPTRQLVAELGPAQSEGMSAVHMVQHDDGNCSLVEVPTFVFDGPLASKSAQFVGYFECPYCDEPIRNMSDLNKVHIPHAHSKQLLAFREGAFKCSDCTQGFRTRAILSTHVCPNPHHHVPVRTIKSFADRNAAEHYIDCLESRLRVNFVKRQGTKECPAEPVRKRARLDDDAPAVARKEYLQCNRHGFRQVPTEEQAATAAAAGSKKRRGKCKLLDGVCNAAVVLCELVDGTFSVEENGQAHSHSVGAPNLRHMRLPQVTIDFIDAGLLNGVPAARIVEQLRHGLVSEATATRSQVVTMQDVYNRQTRMASTMANRYHVNDPVSTEMLIRTDANAEGGGAFLLYKPQGQPGELLNGAECKGRFIRALPKESFCVLLQTEWQRQQMMRHGNLMLQADATHGEFDALNDMYLCVARNAHVGAHAAGRYESV